MLRGGKLSRRGWSTGAPPPDATCEQLNVSELLLDFFVILL